MIGRRRLFSNLNTQSLQAGDYYFYSVPLDYIIPVKKKEWSIELYPATKYLPIGIVAIPPSHNIYGDNKGAIVSIASMDYSTPIEGSSANKAMYIGQYKVNTGLTQYGGFPITNNDSSSTLTGFDPGDTTLLACQYMDSETTKISCLHDTNAFYSYSPGLSLAPSPYLTNGMRNPKYYQTTSPSQSTNFLSDYSGYENTLRLIELATSQDNWQQGNTITNNMDSGYSPAACCCYKFCTAGTQAGEWYLPSMGELGYIIARAEVINDSIQTMINNYAYKGMNDGVGVTMTTSYALWSSTACKSGYVGAGIDLTGLHTASYAFSTDYAAVRALRKIESLDFPDFFCIYKF